LTTTLLAPVIESKVLLVIIGVFFATSETALAAFFTPLKIVFHLFNSLCMKYGLKYILSFS
ncbi:MAG: hypothetical protein ACTSQR_01255, partial [Promethearchaeota archaeon]